jgi:hypothetical protein
MPPRNSSQPAATLQPLGEVVIPASIREGREFFAARQAIEKLRPLLDSAPAGEVVISVGIR